MLRYRNIKANAAVTGVSDHYFRVCNIAMSAGRPFGDQEVRQQAQAIVIDDSLCDAEVYGRILGVCIVAREEAITAGLTCDDARLCRKEAA